MQAPGMLSGVFAPPAYVTPLMAQQNEQLRQFWYQQAQEIMQVGTDPAEFKNHQLPLARIKKARGPQSSRCRWHRCCWLLVADSFSSCIASSRLN